MKYPYKWPTEKPKIIHNILQTGIDLLEEKIGALSQDSHNPLSRVCVANSCISLEPVRGCPLGCIYCVAGNDCRNLVLTADEYEKSYKSLKTGSIFPKKPEVLFNGDVLVDAMIQHPGFIPNKTIVGIMAGSSEAFLPVAEKETWSIFKALIKHKLRNPVWIVTKFGIPHQLISVWRERFKQVIKNGAPVVISITDTNAPVWLEPYRGDRFGNYRKLKNTGIYISHHLRPIISGVNDSEENLHIVLKRSLGFVKSVCVGGLRIDPAIQLKWKCTKKKLKVNEDYKNLMTGNPVGKQMPPEVFSKVKRIVKELGYNTPVFLRSSQMLSEALGINDFNLYKYRNGKGNEFLNVPLDIQDKISKKLHKPFLKVLKDIAIKIGLKKIDLAQNGSKIYIRNDFNYQEEKLLIQAIGHSNIFNE